MYKTIDGRELLLPTTVNSWPASSSGNMTRHGTVKNDLFHGTTGDVMIGGLGNDIYHLWHASASAVEAAGEGIDTVHAHFWGAAVLAANVENLILASAGSIAGTGNALDNIIVAGSKGATLDGKGGNDVLVGGAGADVFNIAAGQGSDAIVNFQPGFDAIRLQGFGIASFEDLMARASQVGGDVQFAFVNGEGLVLRDVTLGELIAEDFGMASPRRAIGPGEHEMVGGQRGYNANGWYVLNNMWGKGSLVEGQDFTINVIYNREDMTKGTTFTWTLPYVTEAAPTIRGYPEVSFGVNPKGAHASNPTDKAQVFPVKVADIERLVADYDVSFSGTVSGFNVAYDIWLTSVPNGDRSTITNEVMIWVHKGDFPPIGKVVGTYSHEGLTGVIYHQGTYNALVLDGDVPKGQIDLVSVFNRLEELGILSKDEYLASIELGAELVSGNGSLTINNLDFTLETRNADGSTVIKDVTGAGTTVTHVPVEVPAPEEPAEPVPPAPPAEVVDQLYDRYGASIGSQVMREEEDGGATIEIYDRFGKLTGIDRVSEDGAGNKVTQHYDTQMRLTGSQIESADPSGGVRISHFDASAKLTGYDIYLAKPDGSSSLRHYDAAGKFLGVDNTGAVREDGSRWTLHYDQNWALAGAEVIRTDANGIDVEYRYDKYWQVIDREHIGTAGADRLTGNWSRDILIGGPGADVMSGGYGADTFVFNAPLGPDNIDTILDFSRYEGDTIALSLDIFSTLSGAGTLTAAEFVRGDAAQDAGGRIIYNPVTGQLSYDPDGNGGEAAVQFAQLQTHLPITEAQFTIFG